jgi:hypothetical protein
VPLCRPDLCPFPFRAEAIASEGKEKQVYDEVKKALDEGAETLQKLVSYSGCEETIRKAIMTPGPESERAAWKSLVPAVKQLQEFYEYSKQLETVFPMLLVNLCAGDPSASLSSQQALAHLLASVFDFVLRFDDSKMTNPSIQNDFSFYRRSLNRMKASKEANEEDIIKDDLANRMSLFLAYPTPMMKTLTDTTVKFLSEDKTVTKENVVQGLSVMANVCYDMVAKRRFQNTQTNLFCLRAMTGCVIMVDHISDVGAFAKKSAINMKGVITVLKGFTDAPADGLLNAIRFNTVHASEASPQIKALLA